MDDIHRKKYLEYKTKYLKLGGNPKLLSYNYDDEIKKKFGSRLDFDQNISTKIFYDNDVESVYLEHEKCELLTTKKEQYYVNTYDPTKIIEKIRETNPEMIDYIKDKFDLEIKHNCCNAISVILYFNETINDETILGYLNSLLRSAKNVNKYLGQLPRNFNNSWLYRVYMDLSVYKKICSLDKFEYPPYYILNEIWDVFEQIINIPCVEIYTYSCQSFNAENFNKASLRTLRFQILFDPSVKTSIIREADGIISCLECKNLRYFQREQSEKIFYIPNIFNTTSIKENEFERMPYSAWLKIYIYLIDKEYFNNKTTFCDLLAGTFGIKLQLKKHIFKNTHHELKIKLDNYINTLPEDYIITLARYYGLENYKKNDIIKTLSIGFDEIFLLELFKEFTTIDKSDHTKMQLFYFTNTIPYLELTFDKSLLENYNLNLNENQKNFLINNVVEKLLKTKYEKKDIDNILWFIDSLSVYNKSDTLLNIIVNINGIKYTLFNLLNTKYVDSYHNANMLYDSIFNWK